MGPCGTGRLSQPYARRVWPLTSLWLGDGGESGPTVCDLDHVPQVLALLVARQDRVGLRAHRELRHRPVDVHPRDDDPQQRAAQQHRAQLARHAALV